jgi:hypothetical protein
MAGTLSESKKTSSDILFDLTPADDQKLQESDLLALVNFGQLTKPVEILGAKGKKYNITFAVLWDEDYIDVLRRTTQYATDPILRSRIMRRLIVFKAIQKIDDTDYAVENEINRRLLWNMLCKLSDIQMLILEGKYKEIEYENQVVTMDGTFKIAEKLDNTLPSDLKDKLSKKTSEGSPIEEHAQVMGAVVEKAETKVAVPVEAVLKETGAGVEGKSRAHSPKQDAKK